MTQKSQLHVWRKYVAQNYVIQVHCNLNCEGHGQIARGIVAGIWYEVMAAVD